MHPGSKRTKLLAETRRTAWASIEPLEGRRLLSSSLQILVNGQAPTDPIDFGEALQNSENAKQPTKTITLTNNAKVEETGTFNLFNDQDTFDIINSDGSETDFTPFDLLPKASISITVGMQTADATARSDEGADITVDTDATLDTTLNFVGNVVGSTPANSTKLGTLGNGTISQKGSITAEAREDGEGNVVEQISDELYAFQVTSQTTLSLALSASGADSTATGGVVAALLPDLSNGSSTQLSLQERNSAIATLSAPISGTGSASATPTKSVLPAGYYFIYMSASGAEVGFSSTGGGVPQTLNYNLSGTVQQAAPAAISVTGNGAGISSGESSPSTSNGTSFGTVTAGTSEALTFTVKNTGGSALTISGSRPDVSGDFLATSVLPSSIAAGASATFAVAPSNANAGSKSGVVSISTNVGTFTFDVGGTYTAQAAPAAVAVSGNGVAIKSSDTTPSPADGTSFGTVTAGASESLSFKVSNTGGSALTFNGSAPAVSGDFSVTSALPSSIAAGGSATFSVAPINSNAGTKSGVVTISTNVGTFTFDVGGTYTAQAAPAAIAVSGNGVAIASGDTTPSTADGTSFGTVTTGTAETLTFTVKNTGGSALAITGTEPVVTGNFIATASLPSSIAAGASATFSVSPINTNMGTDSGGVSIQTSVGTYTFDVGGTYQAGSVRPQDSKLTAKVTAKKLAKAASSYAFTVVYSDSAGVDLSSLDNHDVLVTGPSGFRKWAKLISATANSDGSVTAVYHVSPPTGSWVKSLNGSYHVYIRGTVLDDGGGTASIFDADGNPDSLTVVGQFTVHIAK